MADNDDFTFDEEEETVVGSEQESDDWGDYEPEKKGGSKRLLYLFLLLFILLGAAAYMFLFAPDDGPSPPVNVVTAPRKPIAAPMPKAKQVPAQTRTAPAPATAPAVKPPVKAQAKSATPPKPAAMPAPVKQAPEKPVVAKVEPTSVAKPAPVKPAPVETKPELFKPKAATAMAAGDYTLSAGAFVMKSSVNGVVKKIRKLGYEPEISEIKRKVEMTRLLVGVYSPDVATKKLREVKKVSSGAFSLNKGSKTAVYAGSFLVLDRARVFADTTLNKNGIQVTEEPAEIDRTLQRVTFGSFASREDAAKAARQVAGKGLEAKPVKK